MAAWTEADIRRLRHERGPIPIAKGRRRVPGQMNKTERDYAAYLEALKATGAVLWFAYEGITLKLAPDCRYTPDFAVMMADSSIELHDCKGTKKVDGEPRPYITEDAAIKMRVAAELFPFRLKAVYCADGLWREKEF